MIKDPYVQKLVEKEINIEPWELNKNLGKTLSSKIDKKIINYQPVRLTDNGSAIFRVSYKDEVIELSKSDMLKVKVFEIYPGVIIAKHKTLTVYINPKDRDISKIKKNDKIIIQISEIECLPNKIYGYLI